jgi:D-methionine transport system substrate-binding protein
MAKFLTLVLILLLGITGPARAADAPLRVGSMSGPYAQIMDFVAKLAAKQGLPIKVIEFTDYTVPNEALAGGDIDVSNFQTKPYLENAIKARRYDIVALEKTIVTPLGLYSHKVKTLAELKDGSSVAIANDPANGGRGLLLLQQAGLIKLKDGVTTSATVVDVVANPKRLKFTELDAAQIPRSLDDVTFAAVNMNYALPAGIDPKSAMLLEGVDSPYALIWTSLRKNQNDPRIVKLMAIYRAPEVKAFILSTFNGSVIPGW